MWKLLEEGGDAFLVVDIIYGLRKHGTDGKLGNFPSSLWTNQIRVSR